jgi:acyl CoA:acetate/3-ketoacid CoA transferase beta subunit
MLKVVTELAVIEVTQKDFKPIERAEVSVEHIIASTEATIMKVIFQR